MKKRILTILLTLTMVFSLLPVAALTAYAKTDSGKCGESASYTLNENGTLRITGSGIVDDPAWEEYKEQIVRLEVSGPSELDSGLFRGYPNLKTVVLGDSVEAIGDQCFAAETYERNALESVEFGKGIRTIGVAAFYGSVNLKQIIIHDLESWCSVEICYSSDSYAVTQATTPLYYGADLLLDGKPVTEVIFPDDIERIGAHAFAYCKSLEKVTIPASVKSIGPYAFYNTPNLSSVTFLGHAPEPEFDLFEGHISYASGIFCSDDVHYPTTLYIQHPQGDKTYTNRVRDLYSTTHMAQDEPDEDPNEDWPDIFLSKKNGDIFSEYVRWPESDSKLIMHGACGEDMTWKLDKKGVLTISGTGEMDIYSFIYRWGDYKDKIKKVVIQDGVTSIEDYAFYGCSNLTDVTIPESVTSIGDEAFGACDSLKDIPISYTVTFDANGGSGAPEAQEKEKDVPLVLSSAKPTREYEIRFDANGGSVSQEYKKVSGTFKNWNTKKDGSGTSYNPGDSYTANGNVTLYAQWTDPKVGQLPKPERTGYHFLGWFPAKTGWGWTDSDSIVTKDTTLYAHWSTVNPYNLYEETYKFGNWKDDKGAYCFGMAITSAAYYLGLLDIGIIGGNADTPLYSFYQTEKVEEPIRYYQKRQGLAATKSMVAGGSEYKILSRTDIDSDWQEVLNYVKNHNYDYSGELGVVAWTKTGSHFTNFIRYENVNGQDRIYVYDSNWSQYEMYYYRDDQGKVRQGPPSRESKDPIVDIGLRSIREYFKIVDTVFDDFTRWLYASKNEIYIDGCTFTLMEGLSDDENYVLYEIPEDMDQVTIIPLKDYATFTYMDKEYSFGEITENTYGVLVLATTEEEAGTTNETFEIYEDTTNEPKITTTFNDVQDPSAWFYEYVGKITSTRNSNGTPLMSGYKDGSGNFGPADPLTRQDFAVILYRLADEPDVKNSKNPFPDADTNGYYYKSILWAKDKGVITGYNDGRFGVGDNITREQVATILYRYARDYLKLDVSATVGNLRGFKDNQSVSTFAKDALTWANGAGIITGKDNGNRIDPQGNAARAEIGAMVLRFINYMNAN